MEQIKIINVEKSVIEQNVEIETKNLINLIESIKNRNYGVGMYINILKGSNNKSINDELKKNKYYGLGKNRSVNWWKELIDNLIKLGFFTTILFKEMEE